jgi:hypothetical protein
MKGIERIKILSSDIKDEQLKSIIDYLLSRTDMNDKYLNEEKSLSQMIKFIMREANEKLKKVSISGGSVAYATDEMVFGWAIHYWDESNSNLNLDNKKTEKEESDTNRPVISGLNKQKPDKKEEWVSEGQLTLFDM